MNWFWEIVKDFDTEQRARLLIFTTGSARVPPEGFASLGFNIGFNSNSALLPSAHTCDRQLVLPVVETKDALRQKLEIVVRKDVMEAAGFGFG